MTENQTIIVKKNYPMRRLVAGIFSIPMLLLLSVVFTIPLVFLARPDTPGFSAMLSMTLICEVLTIVWMVRYAWGDKIKPYVEALALQKPQWKHTLIAFVVGVAFFFGLQLWAMLLSLLGLTIESSETSVTLGELAGWERVIFLYIFSFTLVPVVEELLFRGAILHSFKNSNITKYKNWLSILFTAFLFAIVHQQGFSTATDWSILVWIFLMSTVYGWMVVKWKSVWVSVASHMGYNGMTMLATVFLM